MKPDIKPTETWWEMFHNDIKTTFYEGMYIVYKATVHCKAPVWGGKDKSICQIWDVCITIIWTLIIFLDKKCI